jgi:hypothetical protein
MGGSAEDFRRWLRDRYGDLDALNAAWTTTFWSQRYDGWAEILPPRFVPTFPNPAWTSSPTVSSPGGPRSPPCLRRRGFLVPGESAGRGGHANVVAPHRDRGRCDARAAAGVLAIVRRGTDFAYLFLLNHSTDG